ncbi:MAG: hypothetical protein ACR2NP_17465, partial [Pirellulaceae bacterium]
MSSSKKKTVPKRSKRRKAPVDQQQSGPPPENKQLSRLTVTLVLVPVIGVFLYFTSIVVREALNTSSSDVPDDPDPTVVMQPNDPGQVGSTVGWETADSRARDWDSIDDASRDGWDTEVFAARASEQLNQLKKLLQHPESLDESSVESLATEDISLTPLRPAHPQQVFEDAVLRVFRNKSAANESAETQSGREALVAALQAFSQRYADPEQLRLKLKIFHVEQQADATVTQQTVEVFGTQTDGSVCEENLTLIASWHEADGKPVLTSLQLDQYERSERIDLNKDRTLFSDATESV